MMLFKEGLEDFGIILKGSSVSRLSEVSNNFNHCFIVNNNNLEFKNLAPLIKGKQIVHFVGRGKNAALKRRFYNELEIKNVQFNKAELDDKIERMIKLYNSYGMTCHMLPKELIPYNAFFSGVGDYKTKHPNTGVLSIIYGAHIIKPKKLWIIGLDFYESDYLVRRRGVTPLKDQRNKMERLNLSGQFIKLVEDNPNIDFQLITNANLSKVKNLNIL